MYMCMHVYVQHVYWYAYSTCTVDREHVVDILPHLWVLDARMITGKKFQSIIHVQSHVCMYVLESLEESFSTTTHILYSLKFLRLKIFVDSAGQSKAAKIFSHKISSLY